MIPWPGPRPILWAPHARTVDVVTQGSGGLVASPMRLVGAHRPGYWGADHELDAGTTFGFSIDGGPPLPDPTGTWFPDGIHALSRVLPPLSGWRDDGWRPPPIDNGVLLHLDVAAATPGGTLDDAARLLPHVAALGVQGVELAPLCAYDPAAGPAAGVRACSVHEPLGGTPALARFVDAAHAAGLAVVLTTAHRWAVAPSLGLEAFGPYAVAGRLNLDESGSRGVRDFLFADAEHWFGRLHVDGLALDVEALADRSAVPYLAELANETLATSQELGRQLTLFVDGPGRSDRLTEALGRLLGRDAAPSAADVEHLRRLTGSLTPAARLPLRADRFVRRSHPTTRRAASIVVGDLTRLPGARRAMPWVPPGERHSPGDLDARATTLAFAMLAGTPLVLDTDHAPVGDGSPDARRLRAWCAELAGLRGEATAQLDLALDLRVAGSTLAVRRGRHAVVLAWGDDEAHVPVAALLAGPPSAWDLAAAWAPGTTLDAGTLHLHPRTTAVLRARVPRPGVTLTHQAASAPR
ncbi:hypothetical protein ET495_05680 [Xylanimonas allomyrinae]|uniref:Malto-oligosyltrehalose trehalohydrolase n=1 Tax=Xylanimonas allomyrinae TaxID=2509459 RepID=A0A4P6EJK4_9MICO|nr:hypothetical protein [Xylanimonas allomyrinae]QAY62820.1 hypothetical protein ET495_05680 [Xylanimonas allomyrinae]